MAPPYDKQTVDQLIKKLEEHVEHEPDFSASETAALKAMANAWKGWQILGRGMKWLIVGLGLVAAGVTSINVLVAAWKSWLH